MIRAAKAPRFSSQCASSDQLTAPERHADLAMQHVPRGTTPIRERAMKWGDVESIRTVLNQIRGDA
jgi:hypothetical protein